MKTLGRFFFLGLMTLLPLGVMAYALIWFLRAAEALMGNVLAAWLPEQWYWPGMGILAGVLLIVLVGALASSWVGPLIGRLVEGRINRLPLLGRVYRSLRGAIARMGGDSPGGFREVVFVRDGEGGGRLGLVSERRPLRYSVEGRPLIPVYFPQPFQPGGDFELIPADRLERSHLSVDAALGLVLTGGLAREDDASRETPD